MLTRLGPKDLVTCGVPFLATAILAWRSGGFSPDATAAATLAIMVVLAVLVATTRTPFGSATGLALLAIAALGAFAVWGLASSAWSDSPSRAELEYGRTLLYLAVLGLFTTLGRDDRTVRRLAGALAFAFVAVSVGAIAVYLLPETFPLSSSYPRGRLGWPTSYWNTTGVIAAFGALGAVHHSGSSTSSRAVRVAAAAAIPACTAVLWFTISRGALLVFGLSLLAYLVLARPRGSIVALPVAALTATAACIVCHGAVGVTDAPVTPAGISSGRHIAVELALLTVAAATVRALLLVADRRLARATVPGVSAERVRAAALATLAVVMVAFVVAGGPRRAQTAWEQFSSDAPVSTTLSPAQRFTTVNNNGRLPHYRVALRNGFEPHVLNGTGAGTFALTWAQHRDNDERIVDAHSLYLEVLGELGLVGFVLLILVLGLMAIALVRLGRRERGAWALLAAMYVGWLVGAAFDWYWEMPAVTLWIFAAGGLALSRAAAPRPDVAVAAGARLPQAARLAVVVLLGVLALTPVAIYRSQTSLVAAIHAFRNGDCAATVERSLDAVSALGSRPEPFELLSYCDARDGRTALAARAARAAVRRDPANWEFRYDLALTLAAGGQDPRPAMRAAARRNPRDPRVKAASSAFQHAPPRAWRRIALSSVTLVPGRP